MEINFQEFNEMIQQIISPDKNTIIGIDGESFSGKTTLSKYICEKFPNFQRISLDDYMTSRDIRIRSFLDKDLRYTMFERWYDKEKLKTLSIPKSKNIIIEGTFLLSAFSKKEFDVVFVVKRNITKEARIKRMIEKNKLISKEEAEAVDDVYEKAWLAYVGLHSDGETIYINMN